MCYKQKCKVVSLNLAHPVQSCTLYCASTFPCSAWKVSLSTPKYVVWYFSLDPRETNGKAQPVITQEVTFEGTPHLLGVIFDCPLTFALTLMNSKRSSLDISRYSDASRVVLGVGNCHPSCHYTVPMHSPALCTVHPPGWHTPPLTIFTSLSPNTLLGPGS